MVHCEGADHEHSQRLRTLLRQGFLVEAPPRRSAAGRLEKPYLSTGKSLTLNLTGVPGFPIAVLDAFRQEIADERDPSAMGARAFRRSTTRR